MAKKTVFLIPEGRALPDAPRQGRAALMFSVSLWWEIKAMADRKRSPIYFVTSCYGVISEGDVIGCEQKTLVKDEFALWNIVVAEQIVRVCSEFNTNRVLWLGHQWEPHKRLLDELRWRGLCVSAPLLGRKTEIHGEIIQSL